MELSAAVSPPKMRWMPLVHRWMEPLGVLPLWSSHEVRNRRRLGLCCHVCHHLPVFLLSSGISLKQIVAVEPLKVPADMSIPWHQQRYG
jgi:hypothetical protein